MLRPFVRTAAVIVFGVLLAAPAAAGANPFPSTIELPPGFRPEGITIGNGSTFYVGSISTGAIYRGDLRTGDGEIITPPGTGSTAIGLAIDNHQRLFVAGGPTGQGRVIDARTGKVLNTYQFTSLPSFVNDVVVGKDAAWFTDSLNPVLYRVPLDGGPVETLPLTGDLVYEANLNLNGIDVTPDGRTLVLVQSNTGELFTADPTTGITREIDLGGESVPSGDGILLHGRTLYVVQNTLNLVAVIDVGPDLASGFVIERVGNDEFDVPTTIDRFGNRLYAVNARFTTPPTSTTQYWITGFTRP